MLRTSSVMMSAFGYGWIGQDFGLQVIRPPSHSLSPLQVSGASSMTRTASKPVAHASVNWALKL